MPEQKPDRILFEVSKDTGKIVDKQPVLRSQDEAMVEALKIAKEKGYDKISLQNYTEKGFLFLAYL